MAERRVLRMGHPDLHRVAEPVAAFDTPELHALVKDMWETMAVAGGIGLAAPQIGVSLRLVVFGLDEDDEARPHLDIPRTVLLNPVIEPIAETVEEGWEGCLSLPGMRGVVPRSTHVRYTGRDAHGAPVEREVDGYHARVVQHECDHLDGILYPLRMRDMSTFGYEEELELAQRLPEMRCEV